MPTLTFTYTVEITDAEAAQIVADQDVSPDGTVTARTYGTGLLGLIVSGHELPAIYRGKTTVGPTYPRGTWINRPFPALDASIVLSGNLICSYCYRAESTCSTDPCNGVRRDRGESDK